MKPNKAWKDSYLKKAFKKDVQALKKIIEFLEIGKSESFKEEGSLLGIHLYPKIKLSQKINASER